MPIPGIGSPLGEAERNGLLDFLAAIAPSEQHGRNKVILVSRASERWLGDVRRVSVGGLTPSDSKQLAYNVLRPYSQGRKRATAEPQSFNELLGRLAGHPDSLRLVLPVLEGMTASELLSALRGDPVRLPSELKGKVEVLRQNLDKSWAQLDDEERRIARVLALLKDAANEEVLGHFYGIDGLPEIFQKVSKFDWGALLIRMADVGLIGASDRGTYVLPPFLAACLSDYWRGVSAANFDSEYAQTS
jgi:hypothetical protein